MIRTGQTDLRYKALSNFIKRWGISRCTFAKKADLAKHTFQSKISDRYPYKFDEADYKAIKRALIKLKEQTEDLIIDLETKEKMYKDSLT